MTGFDETVPPDDIDPGEDGATAAADAAEHDLDEPAAPKPMGGDDDLISGQYGPTADQDNA